MNCLPYPIVSNNNLKIENRKFQKGQTLFELVMAIAIGVVIITGIVILTTLSINNSSFARNDANSLRYTQEGLEWVRTERDKNWAAIVSKSTATGQTYCLATLVWTNQGFCSSTQLVSGTPFKRQVVLTSHDYDGNSQVDTIDAVVTISWNDGSKDHTTQLSTQLTNWKGQE